MERLQAEILPASEKRGYTERDALLNQYMKQYRIDAKIEGDSIILNSDQPVRIMLPEMVSDEELEAFRKSLSEQGLGEEIDWQGVKNDFWHMGVGLDHAERLETKADYLASRYTVLKDRIQKQFAGVYANSLTSQLQNVHQIWDTEQDDSALGQFLAKQNADTQEIVSSAGISDQMKTLGVYHTYQTTLPTKYPHQSADTHT